MDRIFLSTLMFCSAFAFAAPPKKALTDSDAKKSPEKQTETGKGKGKKMLAIMETNLGTFTVQLFPEKAPKTVANFVGLAKGQLAWEDPATGKKQKKPLYNGTTFHRVIDGFMIQGGDPKGDGTGDPGYKFKDEISPDQHFSKPGILAMANSGEDTNGCQFFVTVAPTPHLDKKHTIFGEVVKNMDVVYKIAKVPVGANSTPVEKVVLKSVAIVEE